MSVVVALPLGPRWYMASDSAVGTDDAQVLVEDKIFTKRGLTYGTVGVYSACNAVRGVADLPKKPGKSADPFTFVMRKVLPAVREALEPKRVQTEDNPDGFPPLDMLVVVNGVCLEVTSVWGVTEHRDRYAAIGSGAPFALGFLSGVSFSLREPADEYGVVVRATGAVLEAAARNPHVRPPVHGVWI